MYWFVSNYLNEFDVNVSLEDMVDISFKKDLKSFVEFTITKNNYLQMIKLADYLMIENVDVLIDEII